MIVTIDGAVLRVGFGYNPDYISAIKEAPDGRRWNKATREWLLPITINNLRFIRETFNVTELDARIAEMERPLQATHHYEVDWRCDPFKHQIEGLDLILDNPALAIFDDMGLGKTLMAIKAIEHRRAVGKIKNVLIVCPKTVISAWVEELSERSDIKPIIVSGSKAKRTKVLKSPSSPPGGRVFLVNYDLLSTMQGDLAALGVDMLVLDESHNCKSRVAQRAKAAYVLRRGVKYVLLLTGTPITRDPSDIFYQYKIMDERIFGPSFLSFRNYYFRNIGRNFPKWEIRPEKLVELKQKIALRSRRLRKEDVLDLPDKLYQLQTVEMEPEQRRIYREIKNQLMTEINEQTIAVKFLPTRLIRLNQICSGYLPDEAGRYHSFSHGKLRALRELVDGYDGKIVIWAHFIHDIEAITNEFEKENILTIQGSVSTESRIELVKQFQNDPARRLIVIQTQTGCEGITLTAAHLSVRYSRDYSLKNHIQSEDRLHRIGQRHAVTYVNLICENSIERDIVQVLKDKRLMAEYVLGDTDKMEQGQRLFNSLILEKFKHEADTQRIADVQQLFGEAIGDAYQIAFGERRRS